MGLQLIANTAAAIREVAETDLAQPGVHGIAQLNRPAGGLLNTLKDYRDHHGDDLVGHIGPDEIKNDDVFADPVENLRTTKLQLEVAVDFGGDLLLDRFKVFFLGRIGYPFA